MKNMNTTLELPEGSKAVISGKVIDGKNYLVVEVEHDPELKGGDAMIVCAGSVIAVVWVNS